MTDEWFDGLYGAICMRSNKDRSIWKCFDFDDLYYPAVVDDFGNLVYVSIPFSVQL